MVIWSGFGLLVGLAGFVGLILANLASNWFTGDPTYYSTHLLPKLCGAFSAGLISFGVVKLLSRGGEGRIVMQGGTFQEVRLLRRDSLFFIPARYLPYVIFAAAAIVALVKGDG